MNRMKRFMALLLAVVLVAQSGFISSATEASETPAEALTEVTGTDAETIDTTDTEQPESVPEEAADEETENEQTPSKPEEGSSAEETAAAPESSPQEAEALDGTEKDAVESAAPETAEESETPEKADESKASAEPGGTEEDASAENKEDVSSAEEAEAEENTAVLFSVEDGVVTPEMTQQEIQNVIDANEEVTFSAGTYENIQLKVPEDTDRTFVADGKVTMTKSNGGNAISLLKGADLCLQGGEFEFTGYSSAVSIANGGNHTFEVSSGTLNCHDLVNAYGNGGISVVCNDGGVINIRFDEGTSFLCTDSYSGIEINNNAGEKTAHIYTTFDGCETVNLSGNGFNNTGSGIQAANSRNIYQKIQFINCGKVNLDDNHLDGICFQGNSEGNSVLEIVDCQDISFSGNNSWGTNGGDITIRNSKLTVSNNSHAPWGKVSSSASNLCSENLTVDNSEIYADNSGTFCGVWVQEKANIINGSKIYARNNGGPDKEGTGCYFAGNALIDSSEIHATGNEFVGLDFDYKGDIQNSVIEADGNHEYGIRSWVGMIDIKNSSVSCTGETYAFDHMGYGDDWLSRLRIEDNTVAALQGSSNDIAENNFGRTYVLGGSLQADSAMMYPKSKTGALNEQIDPMPENGAVEDDWTKPLNTDGTKLTRFDLNAEINKEVGLDKEQIFTYYDPTSRTEYKYSFRYNKEGEDLTEGESGNAYVWAPVSIIHYDATEGVISEFGTAQQGYVALNNTRGDGSKVGNEEIAGHSGNRYATDYTIYGNSMDLSEAVMPVAVRPGYTFEGWYVKTENGKTVSLQELADDRNFAELYGNLNTEFTSSTKITDGLSDPQAAVDEITVYAKWQYSGTAEPNEPLKADTSKSKEASNLDENYQSNVTLSLPSAQEAMTSDVVFVLDKSTSADVEEEIKAMLQKLKVQASDTGATVNVGVVIFNKEANRVLELTALTDGNMSKITAAIETEIKSGTNLHAGLMAGKSMLDEDTKTADSRKYLVVLSDGITYMYNENPTITACYWLNDGSPYFSMDPYSWQFKYGSKYGVSNWDAWINSAKELIAADSGEYEVPYDQKGSLTASDGFKVEKDSDGYLTSVDKALYFSYVTYREAQQKYNCYAIGLDNNKAVDYPWGLSYMNYLSNGKDVSFDDIRNDIYYLLDAGSKVVDEIGKTEDYDFDFVDSADRLVLTVGQKQFKTASYTDGLQSGETSAYSFGERMENGKFPYVLHYYKDGTTYAGASYGECFVWDINVPVSKLEQVKLEYVVQLMNPKTTAGTYGEYDRYGDNHKAGLYTNNSAALFPVDTNGKEGDPELFQKPTVSYTVKEADPKPPVTPVTPTEARINITKKVNDDNGNAVKVDKTFYAAVFTDSAYKNMTGSVAELTLSNASEVTRTVTVEVPKDGTSRTYYVMETDKDGKPVQGGKDFGYQITVKGGEVTVSSDKTSADVTITNQEIKTSSGGKKHHHSSGSSEPAAPAGTQAVASAQTGDTNNILLPAVMLLVAAVLLGAYGTVMYRKRKRS